MTWFQTKPKQKLLKLGLLTTCLALVWFGLRLGGIDQTFAAGGINKQLNYQGKLNNSDGTAVADATYNIKLAIYAASSGGSCVWTAVGSCADSNIATTTVTTVNGVFSIALGDTGQNSLATSTINWDTDSLYLGVTIRGTVATPVYDSEMTPRKRITSAAYAFNADMLDGYNATSTVAASSTIPVFDKNLVLNLFDGSVSSTKATSTFLYVGANATVTDNLNVGGYTSTTNLVLGNDGTNLGTYNDLYVSGGNLFFNALQLGAGGTDSPGAWHETIWGSDLTPTSTTNGIFVNASSTIAANFRVDGNSTTTGNFTVGTSTFVVMHDNSDTDPNKVGIGTVNPTQTLHLTTFGDAAIRFETRSDITNEGPNNPAKAHSNSAVGGTAWDTPENVYTSNNSKAELQFFGAGTSHYLRASSTGFSIPAGSTIKGIVVEIEKIGNSSVSDDAIRIIKNGTVGSTDKSLAGAWGPSDAYATHGSETDLWGESWTAEDINSADFGVAISVSATGAHYGHVDHIRFTVYYSPGADWLVGSDADNSSYFQISGSSQFGSNDYVTVDTSGNVGIGDTSPLSLFTVGSGDLFQIDGSGNATSSGWFNVGTADVVNLAMNMGAGDLYVGSNATVTNNLFVGGFASTTNLVLGADGSDLGTYADLYVSSGDLFFDGTQITGAAGIALGSPGAWHETVWGSDLTPTSSQGIYVTASSTIDSTLRITGNLAIGTTTQSNIEFIVSKDAGNAQITIESRATDGRARLNLKDDTNEWRLQSDDNFIIRDITNSTSVFTLEAGASADSLYVNSSGNVGVSTRTPDFLFQVGNINANKYFSVDANGNATTSRRLVVGSDSPDLDALFGTGDLFVGDDATITDSLAVDSTFYVTNGEVGIGIQNPIVDLHIQGAGGVSLIVAADSGNSELRIDAEGSPYHDLVSQTDGNFVIEHNDTAVFFISNLGATTTGNLNVAGYASTTNLVLGNDGTNLGTYQDLYVSGSELYFDGTQLSGVSALEGFPGAWHETVWGSDLTPTSTTNGIFVNASSTIAANFRVDGSATTTGSFYVGTSDFVVEDGGNVGIGTSTPETLLTANGAGHFIGNLTVGSQSTAGVSMLIGNDLLSTNSFELRSGTNREANLKITSGGSGGWQLVAESDFNSNAFRIEDISDNIRFVIDTSGNVGIGTETPAQSLEVIGNASTTGWLSVGSTLTAVPATFGAGDLYAGGNATITNSLIVSGLIGLGTTTPTGILTIDGGTAASETDGSYITVFAQNAGGTATAKGGGGFNFTTGEGTGTGGSGDFNFNTASWSGGVTGDFNFTTGDSTYGGGDFVFVGGDASTASSIGGGATFTAGDGTVDLYDGSFSFINGLFFEIKDGSSNNYFYATSSGITIGPSSDLDPRAHDAVSGRSGDLTRTLRLVNTETNGIVELSLDAQNVSQIEFWSGSQGADDRGLLLEYQAGSFNFQAISDNLQTETLRLSIDASTGEIRIPFLDAATNDAVCADADGDLYADDNGNGCGDGTDLAELIPTDTDLEPGDVVIIDTSTTQQLKKSNKAYDPLAVGVVSTLPWMYMSDKAEHDSGMPAEKIALVGRVPVKVSGENGDIAIGDYLTTSNTPGHAMKATESSVGVIGVALESFSGSGTGSITILVKTGDNLPTEPSDQIVVSDTPVINPDLDIDTLVVQQAATFYGTLYVVGEAGFEHKVVFNDDIEVRGKIYASADQAGTAVISANATSTEIMFGKEYQVTPEVTATIKGLHEIFYGVENISSQGFTILISSSTNQNLEFSWIALAVKTDNQAPVITDFITAIDVLELDTGTSIEVEVSDSDTNIEDLSFEWSLEPNIGEIDGTSSSVWYNATQAVNEDTQVVVTVTVSDNKTSVTESRTITVLAPEQELVFGCMDPEALNYNVEATTDDSTCEYEIVVEKTPTTTPPIVVEEESTGENDESVVQIEDEIDLEISTIE